MSHFTFSPFKSESLLGQIAQCIVILRGSLVELLGCHFSRPTVTCVSRVGEREVVYFNLSVEVVFTFVGIH